MTSTIQVFNLPIFNYITKRNTTRLFNKQLQQKNARNAEFIQLTNNVILISNLSQHET